MRIDEIGKIIFYHRKKSGLTQAELGKQAGLVKTVIFDLEKGKMSVQLDTLLKVLCVLNIKLNIDSPLMVHYEDQKYKKARVFVQNKLAGKLIEIEKGKKYKFVYLENYDGPPVSLTMPTCNKIYNYDKFPAYFEGVLPEGLMLENLLHRTKIDSDDYFSQLISVGNDLVGYVTVKPDK